MARGGMTETERHCFASAKNQPNNIEESQEKPNGDVKTNGLRVRFLDEEGQTERMVTTDEVDCAVSSVKKIHILKNRSSSETSILLRNASLGKRRLSSDRRLSDVGSDTLNNNSSTENLNGRISNLKNGEQDKTEKTTEQTKESHGHYKKNCNVYNVNQARTLTAERKKSIPILMSKRAPAKEPTGSGKSTLPSEVCLADSALGKDFTARALGRLSRGLGRLLRRTNSVRISEPDPVYKVAYLGNVLTGWARGESCIEKPLATLWRNYQQTTKPDVVMKLSVTNSGLKGFTKEHGLTEYWSHRITYCASPPHYPKLFCWVYRHEGKKLKHELRCHAVLCTKETVSKKITEDLQIKLKQALLEFKKDRISKQNARLSLANSVYDNPSMPRRKIMLSVGSTNYRPPLERSKSAPKLGAIEELCSEEDEEEAEMKARQVLSDTWRKSNQDLTQTLDRRRTEMASPRKLSCPEGVMDRTRHDSDTKQKTEEILKLLAEESQKKIEEEDEPSQTEGDNFQRLESIEESSEVTESTCPNRVKGALSSQGNYLVTDSDDGSVSSGCETASTAASDSEPTSLPPHYDTKHQTNDTCCTQTICTSVEEVNHVPIGETTSFLRRCTYPPLGTDSAILADYENKFESLTENLTDFESMTSCGELGVFRSGGGGGDNESACSDESGYSEPLDSKDSIIGNTIMV